MTGDHRDRREEYALAGAASATLTCVHLASLARSPVMISEGVRVDLRNGETWVLSPPVIRLLAEALAAEETRGRVRRGLDALPPPEVRP